MYSENGCQCDGFEAVNTLTRPEAGSLPMAYSVLSIVLIFMLSHFSCVSMKWIILSLFCRLGSQSSESGVACLMPQNQEVGCLRKQLFSENAGFLLQRGCGGHRGPTKTSGWWSEWERGAWKLIG